jgi:UDP-galactopyranose mutase
MYDYLIVGSGLFGAVFAHEAHKAGKSVLVIERRDHIGGNIYCEEKRVLMSISMGHIFSIRLIGMCGSM